MKYLLYFIPLFIVFSCSPKTQKTNRTVTTSSAVARAGNPLALGIRSKFLDNKDKIRVYILIEPDRTLTDDEFSQQFSVRYSLLPEYNSRQELMPGKPLKLVSGESFTRMAGTSGFTIWYDLPKPPTEKQLYTGVAMTEITDSKNSTTNVDTPVRFQSGKMSDYYTVFDANRNVPLLVNFAHVGDTIQVRSLSRPDTSFRLFHYQLDFDPALPPMATIKPSAKQLYVDSTATVTTQQPFVIRHEGLHYLVRDTTDTYGIGLVGVNLRYPRYTYPQQLARPLIYMSTNQEMNDLRNNQEPKKALDRYWLALSNGNQQTARKTISSFYRRVELANKLFTGYKEGWKTDRGMVYIIMGSPNRINHSKDREVWVYNRKNSQFSEINFTFIKRNNQFVEDHYELSRFVEFQPIWYPAIEAWRNGEIE
ncbi:MAG: GWxTD domain-containing protein [Siphonobacter sp.]